jgi:hypothetical protein
MLRTLLKKANGPFPQDNFMIVQSERDDLPAFAMINSAYRDYPYRSQFPWHVQITITMQDTTDQGLPTDAEAAVLNTLEDRLEAGLKAAAGAHFIGRHTWNNIRTLDYYVGDAGGAGQALVTASMAASREFVYKIERDDDWAKCAAFLNGNGSSPAS